MLEVPIKLVLFAQRNVAQKDLVPLCEQPPKHVAGNGFDKGRDLTPIPRGRAGPVLAEGTEMITQVALV